MDVTYSKSFYFLLFLLIAQDVFAGQSRDIESLRMVHAEGDREMVTHMGAIFLKKYPASENAPEVLLLLADAENDFQRKRRYLEIVKKKYGNTPWAVKASLDMGKIYLLKGDNASAVREFSSIKKNYKESPLLGEALYLMALSNLANGAFAESRKLFEEAILKSTDHNMKVRSEIGIADAYYLSGEYGKSLSHYKKLEVVEMNNEHKTKVMLNLALSHAALGENEKALYLLEKIVKIYPASLEAHKAPEQIRSLRNKKPERDEKRGIYLQVGVYSTLESATAYRWKLEKIGLHALISEGEVYKVLLGPFSDDIEAQIYGEKLRGEKGIDSFVFEK